METERVAEAAGAPSSTTPATRDAAYRDAAPPPSHSQPPSHAHSRVSSMGAPEPQHGQAIRPPTEVELNHVLTRLEQQVSFNYNMIQGHHQDIARISETVGRMQHEMVQVIGVMEDMRNELRARPAAPKALDPGRYDPADVEVLANQIANVTTKANEVDNLKVQIELMKQRLKRFETQSSSLTPGPPPEAAPSRADQPPYDVVRSQQPQHPPGHPIPAIRPGAAHPADQGRQPIPPPGPVLESQPAPGVQVAHERPPIPSDPAARPPGLRAAEPLPPPAALSGWRPADSFPGPPPAHGHPLRSHPPESDAQPSGWAAVNVNQGPKRALDEHHQHNDSSQPGSPKRPKLAPLKPRSSFGDEHHQSPYSQAASVDPAHARPRVPSGEVPVQPHPQYHSSQVPGQGSTNSYRFITSTGQPEEHWRPAEGEAGAAGRYEHNTTGTTGRGRGRGSRGGRGRGGRGRGGRSSSGTADHPSSAAETPQQEHVQITPDWRERYAQQPATNGHHAGQHAYSPSEVARQIPADVAMHHGVPPHGMPFAAGHEHEFPATPVASNADPYAMANDMDPNSASKKTRTKPIRNSDGILIRKDGRPDMRSVSSANNLRKVHAKKEAEKAEMEGRTPTSGRSLAPANSSGISDDEAMDEGDYDGEGDMDGDRRGGSEARTGTPGTQPDAELSETVMKHREMMNRMFNDSASGPKGTAEAWFPRHEGPPLDVKRENSDNKEKEARWRGMGDATMARDSQPATDREASRQASERRSLEQTPHEPTPSNAAASEPAASEQPESEAEPGVGKSLDSTALTDSAKDLGKKDSTQMHPGGEAAAATTPAVGGEATA